MLSLADTSNCKGQSMQTSIIQNCGVYYHKQSHWMSQFIIFIKKESREHYSHFDNTHLQQEVIRESVVFEQLSF